MKHSESFFDFAARIGLTKHLGGQDATNELIDRTRVTALSYVLDVGSGVGATACFLAENLGCRVMGVDLNPLMVEQARERARKMKLDDLVEFQTADAQDLPFPDDTFNVVLSESATAFLADKNLAVREYARVSRPGGFIGLNEATWLQIPVPDRIKVWAAQDLGANVSPLLPEGWVQLLQEAGLKDIYYRTSTFSTREESRGLIDRYGWDGFVGSMGKAAVLYLRSRTYREFVGSIREDGIKPRHLEDYFGFGIYIGKKELFNGG